MISKKDISDLASLSRIRLTSTEEESLATDLENILAYVSELESAEVGDGSENETALVRNVLREDQTAEPLSTPGEILGQMPKVKDDFLVVKKILN